MLVFWHAYVCLFSLFYTYRKDDTHEFLNFRKDFATAWMNLGIAQSALQRYEESEASYLTALQYRSNYPDCFYNLGVLVSKA